MKQIRYYTQFLAILLAAFLLTACPNPEPEPTPQPENPSLQVSASTLDVSAEGGSQTVNLTSNYEWTAKASDSWIQVSPASGGKGSASLTIKADANNTGKARKGSVLLTCHSVSKVTITVNQAANLSQSLVIKHDNPSFAIPVISGSGVTGKVNWGDGAEENYSSSLNHTYSSSGSHTVTIKLNGGTSFDLKLTGVSEVDVTEF